MALTPFGMEGVNRDLLAAGNPAKPDMQSILRRNARDLVLGNAIDLSAGVCDPAGTLNLDRASPYGMTR
ncbi:hypothetical protein [Bifidobacterium breve]|uniref:hypothetical protein n=1 Tax=Bifidobacterium breve TaxID=1685 RepID=UPI0011830281|nr:hypothetical protein [Bifidobacterium breve]